MTESSSSTVADWANYYARAGFRSFPIWPQEKRPIYNGWQSGATTDPELIGRYFSDPTRNVALICGESFDAWDIEVEHVPAFSAWLTENDHVLPEAPIASTGRGGLHILTAPTGVDGTRYLYLNGTHIGELKSRGGFILVCPSMTEQMYRWTWLPDNLAVQPAPGWLQSLAERPERPKKVMLGPQVSLASKPASLAPESDIRPLVAAVRASVQNDRNANLHWAANRAYDDGVPQALAIRELLIPFMEIALPGESRSDRVREGRATIASAYNR